MTLQTQHTVNAPATLTDEQRRRVADALDNAQSENMSLLREYVRLNAKGKCPPRNLLCYQTTIWSTSVEMAR